MAADLSGGVDEEELVLVAPHRQLLVEGCKQTKKLSRTEAAYLLSTQQPQV